jgi:hypothetical protein
MFWNLLIELLIRLIAILIERHLSGNKLSSREREQLSRAVGYMEQATELAKTKFSIIPTEPPPYESRRSNA